MDRKPPSLIFLFLTLLVGFLLVGSCLFVFCLFFEFDTELELIPNLDNVHGTFLGKIPVLCKGVNQMGS